MKNKQLLTGIMVIAIIGILTAGGVLYTNNQKSMSTDTANQPTQQSTTRVNQQDTAGGGTTSTQIGEQNSVTNPEYADGQYMAVGTYISPGGQETIAVSVTLKNSLLTSVEVTPNATLPISASFQKKFADGIASVVVGKSINEIQLDAISGSSLTPKGFVNALEEIKIAAQV